MLAAALAFACATAPDGVNAQQAAWAGEQTPEDVMAGRTSEAAEAQAPNFLQALFGGLFGAPALGPAESACLAATPLYDIGDYPDAQTVPRDIVQRMQRATVRISLRGLDEMNAVIKDRLKIGEFSLNAFYAGAISKAGFCTGTLIASNIVLTAGHCVSPRYWAGELNALPPELNGKDREARLRGQPAGRKDPFFKAAELAPLMKVDVNYQLTAVANAGGMAPEPMFSVGVAELVDWHYVMPVEDAPFERDFAILRLEPNAFPLAQYAIGLSRVGGASIRSNMALAIIQHPQGGLKKVAAGNLKARKGQKLTYGNISTDGGSSGAGILNAAGRLVGIHNRGGCSLEDATSANAGTAITAISKEVDTLRGNGQ